MDCLVTSHRKDPRYSEHQRESLRQLHELSFVNSGDTGIGFVNSCHTLEQYII